MNSDIAKQIVDLVNSRNNLPEQLNTDDVYNGDYLFLEADIPNTEKSELICCARAKRMSFFAYELKHLSVNPAYERKGYGQMMINMIEAYSAQKRVPIVMATSNINNASVNRLFSKLGYTIVTDFVNSKTNHVCHTWQKVV